MRHKTGLIIGRFQPFHKGHLYLVKKALEYVDEIIIGVGSVNIKNNDNPFNFKERKNLIEVSLEKYKIINKIKKIVPIDDYPDNDDIWLDELKKKTGSFNVVFGNNEWVNGILEDRGVKVVRFKLYKRNIYEGKKIREEMKKAKNPLAVLKKHEP
ncbi:MAG: adenylyltransferase/cytidyltransferase family protein [Nanoarchaeota archaeon]